MSDSIIKYNIKYSNRRTIAIVITSNKEVIVRAPKIATKEEINRFVNSKSRWINEKLSMLNNRRSLPCDIILFLGKETKVKFNIKENISKSYVVKNENEIIINSKNKEKSMEALEKFLKEETLKLSKLRVNYYEKYFNIKPQKISVRKVKSRWGSCSYTNNLNFNSKLIMAPLKVFDYVVIHEMCHMVIKNHSKNFYNLVKGIIPNYKECENYLKYNGYLLQILHLQPK